MKYLHHAIPLTADAELSKKELDDLGLFASLLGHIGDGNFHESIMYNRNDPTERAKVEKVVDDMVDRALEMEGSCTVWKFAGSNTCPSLIKTIQISRANTGWASARRNLSSRKLVRTR